MNRSLPPFTLTLPVMPGLFAGTKFDIPPTCDRCSKPETECQCPPAPAAPTWLAPSKQRAKIRLDRRKHQRIVTVVWGLAPHETDLRSLLSELKGVCGAGGSVKDECIELQGDHLTRVTDKLAEMGYRV